MNREVFIRKAQDPRSNLFGSKSNRASLEKKAEKDILKKETEMLKKFHLKRAEEKLAKEAKKQMKTPEARAARKDSQKIIEERNKMIEENIKRDKLFQETRYEVGRKMKDDAMKAFIKDKKQEAIRLLATSYVMMASGKVNEGEIARQLPRATEKINELNANRRFESFRGSADARKDSIGAWVLDLFS